MARETDATRLWLVVFLLACAIGSAAMGRCEAPTTEVVHAR